MKIARYALITLTCLITASSFANAELVAEFVDSRARAFAEGLQKDTQVRRTNYDPTSQAEITADVFNVDHETPDEEGFDGVTNQSADAEVSHGYRVRGTATARTQGEGQTVSLNLRSFGHHRIGGAGFTLKSEAQALGWTRFTADLDMWEGGQMVYSLSGRSRDHKISTAPGGTNPYITRSCWARSNVLGSHDGEPLRKETLFVGVYFDWGGRNIWRVEVDGVMVDGNDRGVSVGSSDEAFEGLNGMIFTSEQRGNHLSGEAYVWMETPKADFDPHDARSEAKLSIKNDW